MVTQTLRLLAIALFALLAATYGPAPANALSRTNPHLSRQIPAHGAIAKRNKAKRSGSKRCKPRPSTSTSVIVNAPSTVLAASSKAPVPSPEPASSKVPEPASSSKAPEPVSSSKAPAPAPASPSAVQATTKAAPSSPKPPAPTSTPSTPPAPPSSNNGSKKVGLAWPNGPTSDLQYYATDAVGWIYSWSPHNPDPNHKYDLEFMPMLWGPDQVDDFETLVKAGYAKYVLAFNEPNEKGQSNLDPGYAAQLWKQHIEPKRALGYKTCSPATSSNPNGFTWMTNFLNACNGGCTVDYMCVHWYDVKAADFKTYVEKWHSIYNKDIFITEFAPQNFNGGAQPSVGDVWNFYQTVMPWIEQTSYIKGAFPFGFMHDMSNVIAADQLMAANGQPTDLGWYIINGNY